MAKKQYGLGHTRLTVPGRPDLTNKTAVVMVGDKTLEEALEGAGGVSDYSDLTNKPSINGVELSGNKTSNEIGVYSKPSGGIPESDLSSDVQQALQKHFKGWYNTLAELKAEYTATEGDSAYVKDASPATTWSIYVYDSTASSDNYWADSGTDADTSNVQTFASGEEVNEVHIVNDLTTGGVNDVLSAEQGKVIANTTMELVESKNLLDPSTIVVDKNVSSVDGTEKTGLSSVCYGCTGFFEIPQEGLICNHTSYVAGVTGCAAVIYDDNKDFVVAKDNVQGSSLAIDPTNHPTWKYVRFNLSKQSYLAEGENFAVYKGLTLIPYEDWFEPYFIRKPISTNNIEDSAVNQDKVSFHHLVESANILNPLTIKIGKYARSTDGEIVSGSTGYGCSDYIELTEEGLCTNHALKISGISLCSFCVYDDDKHFITYGTNIFYNGIPTFVDPTNHPTWKYVVFNFSAQSTLSEGENFAVYRGIGCPEYSAYMEPYYELNDSVKEHSVIEVGKNKLNPRYLAKNTYINSSNGGCVNNDPEFNLCATWYIPVSKLGLVLNHAPSSPGSNHIGYAVYDSSKTYIRGVEAYENIAAIYTYQEGDAYVRFTVDANYNDLMIEEGTVVTGYEAYTEHYVIDKQYLPNDLIDDDVMTNIEQHLAEDKILSQTIEIILPDVIYAVRGDTLQVFYQGMLKVVNPENYNVLISCGVGKQFPRYYEYDCPLNAELGDKTFTVTIKDNNRNVLGTKSCILRIVDAPSSPSSNVNILCVGDSLTAGGVWPSEANRRLKASDGTPIGNGISNITFVGRLSKESGGETAYYEGNSGYAWKDYVEGRNPKFRFYIDNNATVNQGDIYSNNGYQYTVTEINIIEGQLTILTSTSNINNVPQASGTLTKVSGGGDVTIAYTSINSDSDNPFWDGTNNKISFKYYLETVCGYPTDTSLGAVYVLLGGNGIETQWDIVLNYVKTFVDTIHVEFPACKVMLMDMHFPSMKIMMSNYGASGSGWADTYGMVAKLIELHNHYYDFANSEEESGTSGDAYNTFVQLVSVATQVDTEYNQYQASKSVNTRNSAITEQYGNNGCHLLNSGYLQIGDIVYRNIVANFCQ